MGYGTTMLAATAAVALGGAALAQEGSVMTLPDTAFGRYAAFAKLEANIAEMTAGTLVAKMLQGDAAAAAAMDLDDPADDIAQVEGYVAALEKMTLGAVERGALDGFKATWSELLEVRAGIAAAEKVSADDLKAYWEKANALDEMVDEALESLMKAQPVTN